MARAAQDAITPAALVGLVARAEAAFAAHRDEIDQLNVFPVPDGDTGTNLLMTMRALREDLGDVRDVPRALRALPRAALLAARGNSGVIFSQVVRALAELAVRSGTVTVDALAAALERARDLAYEAVAEPVEGTMLSAIAAAAKAARAAADEGAKLAALLDRVAVAVADAVRDTQEQLEELRRAHVVDAGARGFQVFWEALRDAFSGAPMPEPAATTPIAPAARPGGQHETGSLEFRFEVQYVLEAAGDAAKGLRRQLGRLGDSVVVVATDDVMNVHVHTNDVGAAIEAGAAVGLVSDVNVTEFADQIARREDAAPASRRSVNVIAVLPDCRLHDVARDHGAIPVAGRAGDLPSVSQLLDAVVAAGGIASVVLPGHRNVVPAATQVAALAVGTEVTVVTSATSIPSVLAALAVNDVDVDAATLASAMGAAASGCRSGDVVAAVRDAATPVGDVAEGQPLGVVGGRVIATGDDLVEVVVAVARHIGASDAEVLTVVVGADVEDATRERARAAIAALSPEADIELIDGGQRPALFCLGAE